MAARCVEQHERPALVRGHAIRGERDGTAAAQTQRWRHLWVQRARSMLLRGLASRALTECVCQQVYARAVGASEFALVGHGAVPSHRAWGRGALSTSRGTAHHGRGGVGFHGWRRACLQRDGGQGQWWWEDCARSSIGEECVATMPLYTGGGAPRPVPIWACPSRSQPVRAAPVRVVVASHENDRRTIGQKHSRSTVRRAPVEDPCVAVHHHSTVALCPFPLGPILRPLQFCFVFLTLVSVVVSSVPTATGAKAMATRHADICAERSAREERLLGTHAANGSY